MATQSFAEEVFDARIKLPFTCIAAGAPLSGKTTFVRRLLKERRRLIDGEIGEVIWFYGQETDHIRKTEKELNSLPISFVKGLPESFDEYIERGRENLLFVIDDLMQSAGGSPAVTELFCNKLQHAQVSVILLLQNLFYHGKERTTLVRCAQYLVIFKNPLDKSIPFYLAQKLMPQKKSLFMALFESATSKAHGYLFCDGKQDTPERARFRTDIFDEGIQKVYVIQNHAYKKKAEGRLDGGGTQDKGSTGIQT